MSSPALEGSGARSSARPMVALYGIGVAFVAVGSVFPWLSAPRSVVAAWDLGVLWVFTGRLSVLHIPPSLGAVLLVLAIALAWPLFRRGRIGGVVAASLSGAVLALVVLSIVRGLGFDPNSLPPHAGAVMGLAGGLMTAVASIAGGNR